MNLKKINIFEFHIINLLVGFFLVILIPFFFDDFDFRYITYPFRIFTVFISFCILYLNYSKKWNLYIKLITLFFILYFMRMMYDLFILKIEYAKQSIEYIATYLGAVVIPAISIYYIEKEKINWKNLLFITYILFYFFAFVNISFYDFSGVKERSSGITPLWPIGFGQVGVTLSILSVVIYNFIKKNSYKILILIGFFMGLIIIMMSASKGPVISLLVAFIAYVYIYGIPKLFKNKIFLIMIPFIGIMIWKTNTLYLIDRILQSLYVQDASTIQRLEIIQQTLENIKQDFFTGSSFLIKTETIDSFYPHNLLLESFMTIGFLGGILFVIVNVFVFMGLKKIVYSDYAWVIFIFIQYFTQTLFSTSLYSSTFYWILLVFLSNNQRIKPLHR